MVPSQIITRMPINTETNIHYLLMQSITDYSVYKCYIMWVSVKLYYLLLFPSVLSSSCESCSFSRLNLNLTVLWSFRDRNLNSHRDILRKECSSDLKSFEEIIWSTNQINLVCLVSVASVFSCNPRMSTRCWYQDSVAGLVVLRILFRTLVVQYVGAIVAESIWERSDTSLMVLHDR